MKLHDAPAGSPLSQDSITAFDWPLTSVTVMELDPDDPSVSTMLPEFAIEKSNPGTAMIGTLPTAAFPPKDERVRLGKMVKDRPTSETRKNTPAKVRREFLLSLERDALVGKSLFRTSSGIRID